MVRRLVVSLSLALFATSSWGCLGCGGELEAPSPSLATSLLLARFPDDAARVIDAGGAFTASAGGFVADTHDAPELRGGLEAFLPHDAREALRFALPSGFTIEVRERALHGEGALAGRAVAYPSAGGSSFWTAGADHFEEWLSLEAGVATGEQPVGVWDIEGARLRARGDMVEILDDAEVARIRVRAPEAITASGARITPWLRLRGQTIELWADARGEAVLVDPTWTATSNLATSRAEHTATLLADGRVLVTGGVTYTKDCLFNGVHASLASVETFDPATAVWSAQAPMSTERYHHSATRLPNGKVLVAGGYVGACNPVALGTVELFDPVTNTWSAGPPMAAPRGYHSATLLVNGKVLIAGGFAGGGLAAAEIYDPVANSWSAAAPLPAARYVHVATPLADGRVLVAAGQNTMSALATAAVYDPAANTWTPTASMVTSEYFRAGATMSDGRVLVTGGFVAATATWQKFAEIYDPATNAWSIATPLPLVRANHDMLLLGSGHVLVSGGESGPATPTVVSHRYDVASGTWLAGGNLASAKKAQTLTLLADGRALAAGGITNFVTASTASIFDEGGAAGTACANASECASGFCVDGVCCNVACAAGACDACSVATGAPQNGVCAQLTGPVCNDGNACTTGDVCQSGVCAGAPDRLRRRGRVSSRRRVQSRHRTVLEPVQAKRRRLRRRRCLHDR
jgi:N-acetylneuraminic acid mutarotase